MSDELGLRLQAIEDRLANIERHLGIGPPWGPPAGGSGLPADIVALAHAGNKIGAIKELRARTGWGLAEAKDAIDAIAPWQDPI